MKKIFLIILCVFVANCFVSCSEDEEIINDEIILPTEDEVPEDVNDEAEPSLPSKPTNSLEIIELADSFDVDTSLLNFSLNDILVDTQLKLNDVPDEKYQSETAYLGDSVTLGLGVFGNHPKELVIAKGSINPFDAVQKKLIELEDGSFVNFPDALAKLNVKRAVLTFGANAISVMSEESFLNSYISLIEKIKETSPNVDIIIQSISPIATTSTLKKFTNVLINRSNLLLLVLSYSQDVMFLNSAPDLKGADGFLKPEYCSSADGIHINEAGYKIWIDYLNSHKLIDE